MQALKKINNTPHPLSSESQNPRLMYCLVDNYGEAQSAVKRHKLQSWKYISNEQELFSIDLTPGVVYFLHRSSMLYGRFKYRAERMNKKPIETFLAI